MSAAYSRVNGRETSAAVVELGRLSLAFGRVDRITYHPDGSTLESDTDHTVMLGLIGRQTIGGPAA